MTTKKIVAVKVGDRVVHVTMQRHHWSRKLSLSISASGQVRLSVPPRTPWRVAEQFLVRSTGWLETQLSQTVPIERSGPNPAQRRQARTLVERKLALWQPYFSVQPARLRIANQSSRWGSASSRGTLSFNWRIIELPDAVADYLVVHELAHLGEANHGPDFWRLVERALPDYKDRRRRLRAFALHD